MTGVLVSHSTPSSVPATSAASVGGRTLRSRRGQATPTISVTVAIAAAPKLTCWIRLGHSPMAWSGPPVVTGAPRNGSVCSRMMMIPIPDMKPEITEYGVYAASRPIRSTPSRIWIRPVRITIVKTSVRLSACVVTMTAIATAIGPVGPEICDFVPPNTAAKKPTAIAPYSPATAPSPDATPKASATGSPTTAAVTPPKTSPRKTRRL